MNHTINLLYAQFLGSGINACYGRINNGCRAAGLTNNNISFHCHISFILFVFSIRRTDLPVRPNLIRLYQINPFVASARKRFRRENARRKTTAAKKRTCRPVTAVNIQNTLHRR